MPEIIQTELTSERQELYDTQMHLAPPDVLTVARILQRAAFGGRREFEPNFRPAPVYLAQAVVLSREIDLCAELEVHITTWAAAGHS